MPHAADALLSDVLDMAGEAIVVLDVRACISAFSRAGEKLFGWPAAEALGQPLAVLLAEEDGMDRQRLEKLGSGVHVVVGRHKAGHSFPLTLELATRQSPAGPHFIAVLRERPAQPVDVERLARLEAENAHLARLVVVEAMGPALAHELSQPLTAAALYLQAAETMLGPQDAAGAMIGKARREAERAGRIIRALRRFVENRPPESVPVVLDLLVDEAIDLALLGRSPRPVIARDGAETGLTVMADPVLVQQIVVNVVRNALDAVEGLTEARLWIATRRVDAQVHLSIRDSGPGFPAAVMADLFAPLQTSKPGGIGLGLVLSRSIAEQLGGSISVEPGGGGMGATVSVVLPLARQASPKAVKRSA
ncbi:MAG: PAS domain-containing protein [Phreatobacter sp.]|nr:PAS domain-containing protein [Phreatobacter sp.]